MSKRAQSLAATRGRVLLVDADREELASLKGLLEAEGFEVTDATSRSDVPDRLASGGYDVIITDAPLHHCAEARPTGERQAGPGGVPVIRIGGYRHDGPGSGASDEAVFEYLARPLSAGRVTLAVRRAVRRRRLGGDDASPDPFAWVITQDPCMSKVFELIEAIADTPTTVLLTGESGTGKSLIARTIHACSSRRDRPFVEVPCGALPEGLLESELFGHAKGAFTHAVMETEGKFAVADGGTIFLDEIATASPQLQVKLLRVLQDRQFEKVGSNLTQQVDVRVILATNHDLWEEVQAGRFREDLYYRINVVNITLPPLRDRVGDIPLLADHFRSRYAEATGKNVRSFTPEALALMQQYDWPGNVRELENCVERAVVLCRGELIGVDDLPPTVLEGPRHHHHAARPQREGRTLEQLLAGSERQYIIQALRANGGNRTATAEQLGINRTTLYKKMKKHGLIR